MLTRRSLLAAVPTAAVAVQFPPQNRPRFRPRVGVLGEYTDSNLDWVKSEGFTSMQLRLDPAKVDDARIADIKSRIEKSGLYISSLACDGNHIDPDPAKRDKQIKYTIACIELCGKLGIPNIGGQSGKQEGRPLPEQVNEIVRVYTEKYFPALEKNKVRILWEPYAGGPNIATGPIGWEALFNSFDAKAPVGLQMDISHLVWQMMDPIQASRDFAQRIYDVHLKDTEILYHVLRRGGIQPVNRQSWWRFRIPGAGQIDWKAFFSVLADAGYQGAMNIENEDRFYEPSYDADHNFTEQFKRGFRVGHEFLMTLLPPVTA